jgi:hypothetical protein
MFHLNEGTLEKLVSATATASDVNRILRHVEDCRACARRLEEWRDSFVQVDQFYPELAVTEGAAATATPGGLVVVPGGEEGHPRFRLDFANLLWILAILLALVVGYGANRLRSSHEGLEAVELPRPFPSPQTVAGRSAAAFPQRPQVRDSFPPAPPVPSILTGTGQAGSRDSVSDPPRTARPGPDAAAARPDKPAPTPPPSRPPARPDPADIPPPAGDALAGEPRVPLSPQFRAIRLIDAARRLGGPVRMLSGMVPDHVEIGPGSAVPGAIRHLDIVRVVYRTPDGGRMLLDQQLIPADSTGYRPIDDPTLESGQTAFGHAANGVSVATWLDEEGYRLSLAAVAPADSLKQLVQQVH